MIDKLRQWILPKEINFFDSLAKQSLLTSEIIRELAHFYVENSSEDSKPIFDLIDQAKQQYSANLMELNSVFITPVDKEAISRLYIQLHWVELSVKHLIIEINAYQIFSLNQHRKLFDLLYEEMKKLTEGIKRLGNKQNDQVRQDVNDVIHLDNKLIEEYAKTMALLFQSDKMIYIMQQKEILTQIKEISKRIHICGNYLEDIAFKMN